MQFFLRLASIESYGSLKKFMKAVSLSFRDQDEGGLMESVPIELLETA